VRNDTKPALQTIRPDVGDGESDFAHVFTVRGGQTVAFQEYTAAKARFVKVEHQAGAVDCAGRGFPVCRRAFSLCIPEVNAVSQNGAQCRRNPFR
jgi:hypothetical protein